NDLLEDRQPFIEANEDIGAFFEEWAGCDRGWLVLVVRRDAAGPGIVAVPEEVADAAFEADSWEDIRSGKGVVDRAQAVVGKHRLAELVQAHAAREPPCRDNHAKESRVERLGLLDELLVDGARLRTESIRVELIRRVANDHVELHIASKQLGHPSLD